MFRIFNTRLLQVSKQKCETIRFVSNLFEPPYLAELRPKVPVYPCVNFQLKGYDFAVLESYHRFLNRTASRLDLDVSENWATPPQHLQITRLKPRSTTVESEYKLSIYERNVQIYDLPAHFYPIYLRLAQAALPEGVTMKVMPHQPDSEEIRFVPDTHLRELQDELDELGGARPKRYKGKKK